jgi:uncharacterized protein (TIGR03118 family)
VTRRDLRRGASALALTGAAFLLAQAFARAPAARFAVSPLVSDGGVPARYSDRVLVNAWGLAASPTGPWWTANEARDTSSLYAATGRKQLLTVRVPGGPTGVVYYGGRSFVVHGGGRSDRARFIYACEDGRIRAWSADVPGPWSSEAVVAVDDAAEAAVFRGVSIAGDRLYATDFHNDRVDVFDGAWKRIRTRGTFDDPTITPWYAPAGAQVIGKSVFVTYVFRAPVDGNDAPGGGYVDEFDLEGRLVARVAHHGLAEPWGVALAPRSFRRFGGDLLVASFGTGHIDAFRRAGHGWRHDGTLAGRDGKPLVVNGVWGIAFGNGGLAGPRDTLFAAAGPHRWHGASELAVHGLVASVSAVG